MISQSSKKPYIEFNTQKRIEGEKNVDKDGKAFHKLMNKGIQQKRLLEMNLVAIQKIKTTLPYNKPA